MAQVRDTTFHAAHAVVAKAGLIAAADQDSSATPTCAGAESETSHSIDNDQ